MRTFVLTENQLMAELKKAFECGQINERMMEAGLERNESDEYVRWNINRCKEEYYNGVVERTTEEEIG